MKSNSLLNPRRVEAGLTSRVRPLGVIVKLLLAALMALLLAGCSGMVMEYSPIRRDDGLKGYTLRTVYGGLNGDRAGALTKLDKEANRLCPGGYTHLTEEEHARQMKVGNRPNGEVDLVWEVACEA